MLQMLDREEVLSFGLDDYVNDQFGLIYVQAKDLHFYIIDFEKKDVVYKMDRARSSVNMTSIYFSLKHRTKNLPHFEQVKEYIEE